MSEEMVLVKRDVLEELEDYVFDLMGMLRHIMDLGSMDVELLVEDPKFQWITKHLDGIFEDILDLEDTERGKPISLTHPNLGYDDIRITIGDEIPF